MHIVNGLPEVCSTTNSNGKYRLLWVPLAAVNCFLTQILTKCVQMRINLGECKLVHIPGICTYWDTHTPIVQGPEDNTRNQCHSSYVKTQVSSSLSVLKVHSHLVLMTLVLTPLTRSWSFRTPTYLPRRFYVNIHLILSNHPFNIGCHLRCHLDFHLSLTYHYV
jgi:hypothetical protein